MTVMHNNKTYTKLSNALVRSVQINVKIMH